MTSDRPLKNKDGGGAGATTCVKPGGAETGGGAEKDGAREADVAPSGRKETACGGWDKDGNVQEEAPEGVLPKGTKLPEKLPVSLGSCTG